MSLWEIFGGGAGVTIVLLTLIQVAPIKIDPWSSFFGWIGKHINSGISNEIADVRKTQTEIQTKLEKHITDDDEREANRHRREILQFNTKLMRKEEFSHEYFTDVLWEIDEYERYCDSHPGYKNNRANMAIENIKRVYEEHEEKGLFQV